MKKKVLYGFIALLIVTVVTGCGKEKEEEKKELTIVCTSEKDTSSGFEMQNELTYSFDDNQYATSYSVATTQKFDDKSLYDMYKTAQEETAKDTSSENFVYDLKSNDEDMTLVFTVTIKNYNVDNAESEEDKDALKASSILQTNEEQGYTCKVNGLDRSELK